MFVRGFSTTGTEREASSWNISGNKNVGQVKIHITAKTSCVKKIHTVSMLPDTNMCDPTTDTVKKDEPL